VNDTDLPAAPFSVDSALATIGDFATQNGISGEQLLEIFGMAVMVGQAFGAKLHQPTLVRRTALGAEVQQEAA
jgi:hypothetical protein